jgi:hypothetical protein
MKIARLSEAQRVGAMLAIHPAERKSRFPWSEMMRALATFLFVVSAPIFVGSMISGYSLRDIRQELASSDFFHDRMSDARGYASTHPGLVDGIKAHRPELQELRSKLCSMVEC